MKKDWWSTQTTTIPEDNKLKIFIDKRRKKPDTDLIRHNRDLSTLKFEIWQKRPELIKVMQSISESKIKAIYHLKKYILMLTTVLQKD